MKACLKFLFALVFLFISASTLLAEDNVVDFESDDPVMNAAIGKARNALPAFWVRFKNHPANESDFMLKVRVSDRNGNEHFWCAEIDIGAAAPTCVIANEPQVVRNVSYGQRIVVDEAQISDWLYKLDGKIKGGETIRVMIPKLPAEEQENVRTMLADPGS